MGEPVAGCSFQVSIYLAIVHTSGKMNMKARCKSISTGYYPGWGGDSRPGHGKLVEQKNGEVGEGEAWEGDAWQGYCWMGNLTWNAVTMMVMVIKEKVNLNRWRPGGWSTREAATR